MYTTQPAEEAVHALYDLMTLAGFHIDADDPRVVAAKERLGEAVDSLVKKAAAK